MKWEPRTLSRWADWGAIAVALLAAVALAVTVLVARAGLRSASNATVRGEGEVLIARVHDSTRKRRGPPTAADLETALRELADSGLRAIAFHQHGYAITAGAPTIPIDGVPTGTLIVRGDRALIASALAPVPLPPRGLGMPSLDGQEDPFPPPEDAPGWPPTGAQDALRSRPPPTPGDGLFLEFTPSVLPRLEQGMNRTIVVGAGAVLVLLSFAVVLTRRAVQRAKDQRGAEQERRLMALGQMSSVMAHELRNPLASLKGNAQLLAEMLDDGTREHTKAELVVREAQRLERLTQDLLSFVRDGDLARTHVSPSALLARALEGLPEERVTLDLREAPTTLWVDEARLAASLGNLVRNALQSSAEDTPVQVRVYARGGDICVEVQDQGHGISAGDEERIFEPFFTKRLHGTGLGLAVARRAVEQHGGTLRAESPATGGALFRVRLPSSGAT